MVDGQLAGVLDDEEAVALGGGGQHRAQQHGLPGARAAGDEEVGAAGDGLGDEGDERCRHEPVAHQVLQAEGERPGDAEAQDRHVAGQRRDHRVHADPVRQPDVDQRRRVVQPATARGRQPDRERPDIRLRTEAQGHRHEAVAEVGPHVARTVDEHVRHAGPIEQGLERPGSGELRGQAGDELRQCGGAHHTTRTANCGGDRCLREGAGVVEEVAADLRDEGRVEPGGVAGSCGGRG